MFTVNFPNGSLRELSYTLGIPNCRNYLKGKLVLPDFKKVKINRCKFPKFFRSLTESALASNVRSITIESQFDLI